MKGNLLNRLQSGKDHTRNSHMKLFYCGKIQIAKCSFLTLLKCISQVIEYTYSVVQPPSHKKFNIGHFRGKHWKG